MYTRGDQRQRVPGDREVRRRHTKHHGERGFLMFDCGIQTGHARHRHCAEGQRRSTRCVRARETIAASRSGDAIAIPKKLYPRALCGVRWNCWTAVNVDRVPFPSRQRRRGFSGVLARAARGEECRDNDSQHARLPCHCWTHARKECTGRAAMSARRAGADPSGVIFRDERDLERDVPRLSALGIGDCLVGSSKLPP